MYFQFAALLLALMQTVHTDGEAVMRFSYKRPVKNLARGFGTDLKAAQGKLRAPVNITVLGEALCPDTMHFIVNEIYPASQQLDDKYLHLEYVAYGNAHQSWNASTGKWAFQCQHGPQECLGNLYHTCLIARHWKQTKTWMSILNCYAQAYFNSSSEVFNRVGVYKFLKPTNRFRSDSPRQCLRAGGWHARLGKTMDVVGAMRNCTAKYNGDLAFIEKCVNSSWGQRIEHYNGLRTQAAQPPHTFVPWVIMDGNHTADIQAKADANLAGLVCDQFPKATKPPGCK